MNALNQLDLFSAPPSAPVVVGPDQLVERLIDSGLARNEFLLNINRAIDVGFGNLPSRLFQFPVEFVDRNRLDGGESKMWLRHPDFAGMRFVDEIEGKTGVRPTWEPRDEFGCDRDKGRFWHAIDLLTDEHFRAMLDTRNFTDKTSVINGLRYHMDYGGISTASARMVLAEYESEEPADRSDAFLRSADVKVTNSSGGKFVSAWTRDEQSVWAAIHGLEDGLFKRDRSGFLRFAPAFLAEKEAAK